MRPTDSIILVLKPVIMCVRGINVLGYLFQPSSGKPLKTLGLRPQCAANSSSHFALADYTSKISYGPCSTREA